jgi:16S rRNA (cytosine1402-N4)-methyltransferase
VAEHQRRPRYSGTHPKTFSQKYKEQNPEKYAADVEKVKGRGQTPAGSHRPILLDEILEILAPAPGETGLDATLGYGGHSAVFLARVQPGGRLIATDIDPLELPKTEARLRNLGFPDDSLVVRRQNFSGIEALLPLTLQGGVDFFLADLGVSSMQIDNPDRGFTFKVPGPLDLRLNPTAGKPAWALLEGLTRRTLEALLTENADEPHAAALARALDVRKGQVRTTTDLAAVVRQVSDDEKSLARTFQALRIAVNKEFEVLDALLAALPRCLNPGARAAFLTFHSGEEGRVTRALGDGLASGVYERISTEPIRPSTQERYDNPRSKSARLHWAVRSVKMSLTT